MKYQTEPNLDLINKLGDSLFTLAFLVNATIMTEVIYIIIFLANYYAIEEAIFYFQAEGSNEKLVTCTPFG